MCIVGNQLPSTPSFMIDLTVSDSSHPLFAPHLYFSLFPCANRDALQIFYSVRRQLEVTCVSTPVEIKQTIQFFYMLHDGFYTEGVLVYD